MTNWSRWPPRPWEAPTPAAPRAIFSALGAWVTIGLGNLGLSLSAAMAIGGAVTNIAIGAALLGAQALIGAAFSSKPTTSTPQAQAILNQSTGSRIRGYGRAKLGGIRAFWDSEHALLHQIVMAHHGQVDAFEQFYVGDIAVTLDGQGYVLNGPLYPYVRILAKDGAADQTAQQAMTEAWSGIWTPEHRLRGIANWYVRFTSPPAEDFQTVFPDGYNTPVQCVCRLSKVWDPRTNTTAWSDNAALCILDYLTHPDGYNRSLDDIDVPSFSAFANVCDQPIVRTAGGTEPRYRLWGIYALTDEPQEVLNKMRSACDAELYQTAEGKIAIRGGAWQAPTVTIRDSDILAHSMEQGHNRFAAFNELKIIYTSPEHDYQAMEATPWENLADQAERGVLSSSLTLDMVPSPTQARRLAKIHIAKANPEWKGTIVANLTALDALGERTVRLVLPELNIDDAFFVAGYSIRPDLTAVELSVLSISEASYTWTIAEEGQSPPIPEDTRPELTFPIPENLTLSKAGGVVTSTVADPGREDLSLHAQIRAGAGSNWQDMQTNPDGVSARSGTLVAGTYQVRARWRGPLNTAGGWTSPLAEITV